MCVYIYIYSSYCVRHDGDIEAFYCTIHVCVYNSDEDINWMAKCLIIVIKRRKKIIITMLIFFCVSFSVF